MFVDWSPPSVRHRVCELRRAVLASQRADRRTAHAELAPTLSTPCSFGRRPYPRTFRQQRARGALDRRVIGADAATSTHTGEVVGVSALAFVEADTQS